MWKSFVQHESIRDILNDSGLAQIGDTLINLCYSLAKSLVTGKLGGEKVRDAVLARAIRATPVYNKIGHRTDAGGAGDAYEAIVAYLWLKGKATIDEIVQILSKNLQIDSQMNRKQEGEYAVIALQKLLEVLVIKLADR